MNEVKSVFRKYAVFNGRSSRREYWYFFLFELCVYIPLIILFFALEGFTLSKIFESGETMAASLLSSLLLGSSIFRSGWIPVIKALFIIYSLGAFIPRLAVTIRRLHDTNKAGTYYFVKLGPEILLAILGMTVSGNPLSAIKNRYLIIIAFLLAIAGNIVLIIKLAEESYCGTTVYDSPSDNSELPSFGSFPVPPEPPVKTNQPPKPKPIPASEPKVRIKAVCNAGALAGKTFSSGDTLCFGRSKGSCNVVFPEKTRGISRIHCCLKVSHGQAVLMDMGSTYGTFLENGRKLQANVPVKINDNTRFYLADKNTLFTVYIEIR